MKQESKRSKAPTRKRQMPRPLHAETFYLVLAPMDARFIGAVVCYGKEYRDEIC